MKTSEWNLKSRDGLELYAFTWSPESAPRAIVCLVHGHGEHIHRYEHVGKALAGVGYTLTGFDLRGHGRSAGQRGHTPSYENLLDDIQDFVARARVPQPDLPLFLYGHSMGGNQVINYALRHPQGLAGVIASDPWLRLAFQPTWLQMALAKGMDRIAPAFSQSSGLDQTALSKDPEIVRAYAADPLVHDKITARLYTAMQASGKWALEHASQLKVPMLLMHGSADRLTSAQASSEFARSAGNLITLRIWDGLFHEIHNEPQKAEVLKVMIDWLDEHL